MQRETGDELAGRRILVTRAREQSGDLCRALAARGAEPVVCPLLRSEPTAGSGEAPDLDRFDWLIVTSPNAVRHLRDRLLADRGRADLPAGLRLAVVGPGTAEASRAMLGHPPDLEPATATGAGLGEAFGALGPLAGLGCLRVRGDLAGSDVEDALADLGARVRTWTIYRTIAVPPPPPVVALLDSGGLAAVTFASGSAVRAFAEGFRRPDPPGDLLAACLGPVTARAARDHGWRSVVTAGRPTVDGLLEALVSRLWRP